MTEELKERLNDFTSELFFFFFWVNRHDAFPCWQKLSVLQIVRYHFVFFKYKNHREIVLGFLRERRKDEKVPLCSKVNIICKFCVRYFRDSQIFSV